MYINGVNIKKHKRVIWNLISRRSDSKLETLVRHMSGDATSAERKAITDEIIRISEPCTRRIDFASYFADICVEFAYEGITHNIDPLSEEKFKEALEKTKGAYNLAIYEEVTSDAKTRYLEMIAEQERNNSVIPATPLNLFRESNLTEAKEETLKSGVFPYDPTGYSDKGLNNQTNNIEIIAMSEEEVVFLTSSQELLNCEFPYLYLWDIDRSYGIGDKIIIKCDQKDTTIQPDDSIEIKMTISADADVKDVTKLRTLIEFREQPEVTKNVTVQSLYKSIEQRIHEHYFVNKTDCVPMILSNSNSGWYANASYVTEDNNLFWHSFTSNKKDHLIERIIGQESFQKSLNESPRNTLYYIASPILINGNKEVICIEYNKLLENKSACSLFKLYLKANRVKLLRFEVSATKGQETQFSPSILQNMIGGNLAMINAKPNAKVRDIIRRSELFMTVHDDTDMLKALNLDDLIVNSKMPLYNKTKLIEKYILPETNQEHVLHAAYENSREIRTEDRFVYQTEISFKLKKDESAKSINAKTVNISSKGLCIEVDNTDSLNRNDDLLVTFNKLNKTLKDKIIEQPYRIMNIIGNSVHLMATGSVKNNAARKTLTKLIYQNLDKLKATGIKEKVYGLSKSMRSIYAQNHINIPFFISREKRQNFIETVLINKHSKIDNLKDDQDLMNFFSSPSFSSFASTLFADLTDENKSVEGYLILLPKIKLKSGTEKLYWIKDLSEILSNENGNEFIKKIQTVDKPAILKIKLRLPGEENNKFYNDELSYLKILTSGMAESLEAYSEDMLAVGELSEVTDIVLSRINSETSEVKKSA